MTATAYPMQGISCQISAAVRFNIDYTVSSILTLLPNQVRYQAHDLIGSLMENKLTGIING